jgi:hypothetical protein
MLHARAAWVKTFPYRAAAVRPRQLPDGKSHRGKLLAAETLAPLIPLPAAWVVTHKTLASVRVSPQSVGMEHPGRSCLTIASQLQVACARAPPLHPTVTCRIPPSGHTP